MLKVAPPSSPQVAGWSPSEYAVGYRARVSTISNTMRVTFSHDELGRDSGLAATDASIAQLEYNVYFPAAAYATIKLPGLGCALGTAPGIRAPGWNTVSADSAFRINGVECGPATPSDIGCYVAAAGPRPEFVYMNSFRIEKKAPQPAGDAPVNQFRFAPKTA